MIPYNYTLTTIKYPTGPPEERQKKGNTLSSATCINCYMERWYIIERVFLQYTTCYYGNLVAIVATYASLIVFEWF